MMILMENRDSLIYSSIFKWLITEIPPINKKELHIMTDFEKATAKSLRKNFTEAQIHGCYFHFVHVISIFNFVNKFYFFATLAFNFIE